MYTNCHSYYSLGYGTFSETDLLELAEEHKIFYITLTDINNTSAVLNFLKEAKDYKVWPAIGVDFRNDIDQQYVMIAKTNKGFEAINRFLSGHLHDESDFPTIAPDLEEVYVIYPFERVMELEKTDFKSNEYIGISVRNLNRLPFTKYKNYTEKLVVQQQVSFRNKADFNAHRLLRCIALNTLLSKLQLDEQSELENRMYSKDQLLALYAEHPYVLENTKRMLQSCKVDFFFGDERTNQNQLMYFESREKDFNYLQQLCYRKLPERYKEVTPKIIARVEKELETIKKMDFVSYFMINYMMIERAKSQGYYHIGRGSGANSIVAYIIGITNVDPIELDLYFERFINVFRNSPPDFDIDFSWTDRDEMTAYLFDTYDNVALLGTYVTFKYKSTVRELGKVFGIPKMEIDAYLSGYPTVGQNGKYFEYVEKYSHYIESFPRFTSVHSSGIIITEKPIYYFSATIMPPKNFETVQFDMNIAEEVGIYKFDILAQRGLAKIKESLALIRENQPDAIIKDIDDVKEFINDPKLNKMLETGDCMGVYYVESPAMRGLMTKMQTNDYIGLVAASSIIRPGVSGGGMKNEFILRHRFPEKRKEAHPVMLDILHETYGVMVYQEDVLKVAHEFAGFSLAEADILRRGMRGKTKSKGVIAKMEAKFRNNCLKKGFESKVVGEVWSQMRAFAGYAFAKGHSASYAVESYQSLYLKQYFPIEFMVAVLNQGGGFYKVETYLHELKKRGAIVEMPCVNNSDHPHRLIGKTVYLGFGLIKGLETNVIQKILNERQLYGSFKGLEDFLFRVNIGVEQISMLIRMNAFRFIGEDKHKTMWKAYLHFSKTKKKPGIPLLFQEKAKEYTLPNIRTSQTIEAYDQISLLGFPLISRFELLKDEMEPSITASQLKGYNKRRVVIYGNLITAKDTPTQNKRIMAFGTFFDRDGMVFDTVHFPGFIEKYPLKAKGIYKITGIVAEELGHYAINAEQAIYQAITPDPRHHTTSNSNKNSNLLIQ
ncbi:DNA polymerase III subunit alpha [Aquimarina sp. ERC-38]|uniref:DNA polymerase III subunit alpha n=1 Tax=Aquimarina sp. ERC-38 TaxID=2949996 RepID=UPI0022458D29|nr:DNA polymerase III subunit alpha [Aquimarina sp. ERC-38]UZO81349.1 DNA polymerase III subunit alpha [Aquimarina sp. ERC-38]